MVICYGSPHECGHIPHFVHVLKKKNHKTTYKIGNKYQYIVHCRCKSIFEQVVAGPIGELVQALPCLFVLINGRKPTPVP